jgi:hypothetical protein
MTGNRLSRILFFWPGTLLIHAGQLALDLSQTLPGRYTIRPLFRFFCRFALYARPYLPREIRTNEVSGTRHLQGLIERHRLIAAIPCACRAGRETCGHPLHTQHDCDACLSFGLAAIIQIGSGLGRRLSQQQAQALCEKARDSGMVHHAVYSFGSLAEVCNCCSETCSVVKAYEAGVPQAVRPAALVARRGPECDVCRDAEFRICEKLCPYGEHPDSTACLGCGLCADHCPRQAITMTRRPGSTP